MEACRSCRQIFDDRKARCAYGPSVAAVLNGVKKRGWTHQRVLQAANSSAEQCREIRKLELNRYPIPWRSEGKREKNPRMGGANPEEHTIDATRKWERRLDPTLKPLQRGEKKKPIEALLGWLDAVRIGKESRPVKNEVYKKRIFIRTTRRTIALRSARAEQGGEKKNPKQTKGREIQAKKNQQAKEEKSIGKKWVSPLVRA